MRFIAGVKNLFFTHIKIKKQDIIHKKNMSLFSSLRLKKFRKINNYFGSCLGALSIIGLTTFTQFAQAGLPKCYAVTDSGSVSQMWFMVPDPAASPLPNATAITLPRTHNGEGSAFRPSTQTMHLFDCNSDNTGPCTMYAYSIDEVLGTATELFNVPNIVESGNRAVEGAVFEFNEVTGVEYLYLAVGESSGIGSAKNQIRKYSVSNTSSGWNLQSGYPVDTTGDTSSVTGFAYDPRVDQFYASTDRPSNVSGGSSTNVDVVSVNLTNGQTTFVGEAGLSVDGEGLSFAADGFLYIEEDRGSSGQGRAIFQVDPVTGNMVKAATFGGSADAESVACNAGGRSDFGDAPASYGYAAHILPFILPPASTSPLHLGVEPGDDDFAFGTQASAGANVDDSTGRTGYPFDDEDGATILGSSLQNYTLGKGTSLNIDVATSNGSGNLSAWVDWNGDGDFNDTGEQIAADLPATAGGTVSINVSASLATATLGTTYARFRYSTDTGLGPFDDINKALIASDGEVEDYQITINQPNLSITKTDSQDPVLAGTNYTYTLTVNATGSLMTNVIATDTLPASVTYVPTATYAGDSGSGNCSFTSPTVTCNLGDLDNGESSVITITVTAPATSQVVSNTASVTTDFPEIVITDNSATEPTTIRELIDLEMTSKSISPAIGGIGDTFTFTLDVINNGTPDATTVTVVDVLPSYLSYVSATGTNWSCSESSGTVTCVYTSTLLNGVTAPPISIVTTATGSSATAITNTASVSTPDFDDSDISNNTESASFTVVASADLNIDKIVNNPGAGSDSTVEFTLLLSNDGPDTVTDAIITDSFPFSDDKDDANGFKDYLKDEGGASDDELNQDFSIIFPSGTEVDFSKDDPLPQTITDAASGLSFKLEFTPANYPPSPLGTTQTIKWTQVAGNWTAGQDIQVIYKLKTEYDEDNPLVNDANVSSVLTPDPSSSNNSDSVSILKDQKEVDLEIFKTGPAGPIDLGTDFSYLISVLNNGPENLVDSDGTDQNIVTIVDTLPAGTTFVSASTSNNTTSDYHSGNTTDNWSCSGTSTITCTFEITSNDFKDGKYLHDLNITVNPTTDGTKVNSASVSYIDNVRGYIDVQQSNDTDIHSLNVVVPSLAVTKVASTDTGLIVGQTITYTYIATNDGSVTIDDVAFSDVHGGSGTLASMTLDSTTGTDDAADLDVDTLAPTETATWTADYTVTQADVNAGVAIDNTATFTTTTLGLPVTDVTESVAPEAAAPSLAVTKVASADTALIAGQSITYTYIATNDGNVTLDDVAFTDVHGGSGTLASMTLDSTTGTDDAADLDVDSLVPTQTATWTADYTVTQADVDAGVAIDNTATFTTATPDLPLTPVTETVTPVVAAPSLAVTKVASADTTLIVGQTITYTYIATNDGNVTLDDVAFTDAHGGSGTLASMTLDSTTGTDDAADLDVDSLAPTQTATWTADYTVTQADVDAGIAIDNTATFTTTTPDLPVTPVTESITVALVIDAVANPVETMTAVEGVTGKADVTNVFTGDSLDGAAVNATNVTLTEEVADPNGYLTLDTDGTVDVAANTPAGTYELTYKICEIANPTNCDTATASVTVEETVDLKIEKTINDATPNIGDIVTFTLLVENLGPGTATVVTVNDILPTGFSYVAASITGGDTSNDSSPAGTGLTWTINSLTAAPTAGSSTTLTFQAILQAP